MIVHPRESELTNNRIEGLFVCLCVIDMLHASTRMKITIEPVIIIYIGVTGCLIACQFVCRYGFSIQVLENVLREIITRPPTLGITLKCFFNFLGWWWIFKI